MCRDPLSLTRRYMLEESIKVGPQLRRRDTSCQAAAVQARGRDAFMPTSHAGAASPCRPQPCQPAPPFARLQDAGHNWRLDHHEGSAALLADRKKGGQLGSVLQLLKLCVDRAGVYARQPGSVVVSSRLDHAVAALGMN